MAKAHDIDIEFLPDRMNSEPPIFLGLTNSELFSLAKLGLLVWIPLCLFLAFLIFGGIKTILGFGAGLLMTLVTIAAGGKYLQRLKRGRPDGFYGRLMKINAQDKRIPFTKTYFLRYTGPWQSRRIKGIGG